MDARDVLDVLTILDEDGIDVTLHGGWGIDAVVGSQDRDHDDVDLLVSEAHLPLAVASLGSVGFAEATDVDGDGGSCTSTLVDRSGRRVDLTSLRVDDADVGWLGDGRGSVSFPPSAFTEGWVGGRQVRCLSAVKQVEMHEDYPPRERDRHDMRSLHQKFGIVVPPAYR